MLIKQATATLKSNILYCRRLKLRVLIRKLQMNVVTTEGEDS